MNTGYLHGLDRNAANYVPLSPISFLLRTANVHPNKPAIIHGRIRRNWSEVADRCLRLAALLRAHGVGPNTTVSVMAPNVPIAVEAAQAVPMTGGVLNALNTRLDPNTIAYILDHGEAKVLLTDTAYADVMREALSRMEGPRPLIIDVEDSEGPGGERIGDLELEAALAATEPLTTPFMPADEWDAVALNYTSGTTGNPKGVVYHHRGAYLNAVGNHLVWSMPAHPVYLWTLPMFHCNGWCFPWSITALAGTHVCLRQPTAAGIYAALADHGVTHLCGAPVIMQAILNAPESDKRAFSQPVKMMTAGSAPPAAVLEAMETLGIDVTHVYGLTEVYGPAVVCAWDPDWSSLPVEEQGRIKARQGVTYPVQEGLMVADPVSMAPTPLDGTTMGEVFMRGNITMKGYLKDEAATAAAFKGGWFHTGDLGVAHPDGYIELKDRSKDIIISGGENISTIEVEGALYRHPDILEAAVVAGPHEKWGETPVAFVTLREGAVADQAGIIAHCRDLLAGFKCPTKIVFGPLEKTSTGKIQKFKLREQVRS